MPAWLIPALKAVLPHVGTIISAAKPVFTRKSTESVPDQTSLLQQQITELQSAASANDTHIRELAAQIRTAVEALEKEETRAAGRQRWMPALCIAAMIVSMVSLGLVLFALMTRNVAS